MSNISADATPLMKQYWELKNQAGDALLFFRMGDFYECFAEDAVVAARILGITLTSRDKNKANPVAMAGVPHHSVQGYIQKLLNAGKKVAIGEQMEDPQSVGANKIVRREITRTFTPGIRFDSITENSTEQSAANYLAVTLPLKATINSSGSSSSGSGRQWVLACLDVSTGESLISNPLGAEELSAELSNDSNGIRHLLNIGTQLSMEISSSVLVENLPPNFVSVQQAKEILNRHEGGMTLPPEIFTDCEAATHALAIAIAYATRSQGQEHLPHLRAPSPLHRSSRLVLGPRASQHLDLMPGAEGYPNLYKLLTESNRTKTSLGARQMKNWILAPLSRLDAIQERQEAVKELCELAKQSAKLSNSLQEALPQVYDLERLAGRISTRLANPRDTLALGRSLAVIPVLADSLANAASPLLLKLQQRFSMLSIELGPLGARIIKDQKEDAPVVSRDGGIFNSGVNSELDRLISLAENGQQWLVEMETREREATGISSLKVRYNRVFGYYLEVTHTHLKNVPPHYQRKQTTVGAERFFTEELKKFEDDILNASTRQKTLEQDLFQELLKSIGEQIPSIMETARMVGELDALNALATLALDAGSYGWCFPELDSSLDLEIKDGRHPLVDISSRGGFVPNDLELSPRTRMTLIITGPNMGGKSTLMRQVALIVILGQMGAPVPASRARWGVFSSLFTRIGAQDAISRGQSTFMVEMTELAQILHHGDERSLIILDEIGRGTSTYDGISVAWATLEWIATKIRARTLFATHYHELTELTGALPLLANAHMAVENSLKSLKNTAKSSFRFLYQLKEGPTHDSFGIQVARLAGLPKPVIKRAWSVLEELERHSLNAPDADDSGQLSLFGQKIAAFDGYEGCMDVSEEPAEADTGALSADLHPEANLLISELQELKLNEITPLQALITLTRLQTAAQMSSPKISNPNQC